MGGMPNRLPIIDAHAHVDGDHEESAAAFEAMGARLLNVALAWDETDRWKESSDAYRRLAEKWPRVYGWCTSFDLPKFGDPGWADRVVSGLGEDFRNGAVACKVWRSVGAELRDPEGRYVQLDHPVLEPVWAALEGAGRPLIIHAADPIDSYRPLDPGSIHYHYFKDHPEAYMHGRPAAPSHMETMAGRDRLVEKHPKLGVIGAHLASLEHDMQAIAARLDRYPNFAIDTSARVMDMAGWGAGAREFCIKYQDRILFGTDLGSDGAHSKMAAAERSRAIATARRAYDLSRAFFTSPDEIEWGWWDEKKRIRGLGLPADVAGKILSGNALRWIPGLARS